MAFYSPFDVYRRVFQGLWLLIINFHMPETDQYHAHCQRLRELQRRYDCADNVGNETGCAMIQGLIDQETARWNASQANALLNPQTTK